MCTPGRIFSWTKAGSLDDPDPITLLICSISGNFLHDPVHVKKIIGRVVAIIWLVVSIWAARQTQGREELEAEEQLEHLTGPPIGVDQQESYRPKAGATR